MIDHQHPAPRRLPARRARLLAGAALGLAATAALPDAAYAQATPGSPQCPVVNDVVTCSGALPDGAAVTSGDHDGLSVSNVTGDMSATQRPVIDYRSNSPTTTITLDDADSTIRLTTLRSGAEEWLGAVQAVAPLNVSFSLTNNMDISILEQGPGTATRKEPVGIIVAG